MNLLSGAVTLYLILIVIRLLTTWFSGAQYGRPLEILCHITDPYLNWFRRFTVLQVGHFDFSPIVAMALLSVANNIFIMLGRYGSIRFGFILAMLISMVWSAVSFLLGFFVIVLSLRLIAYFINANVYSSFWKIIESISQPVLYHINRLLFRHRIVHYRNGLLVSILVLVLCSLCGGVLATLAQTALIRLPI
jgi:YggT family protein